VRNAPAGLEEEILANGLSIDVVSRREEKSAEEPVPAPEIASAPASAVVPAAAAATAMIVDTPVRAGQRIYSRGDLIVTAAVNNGAEVIADGSIHVYAPLRGRALAGASGNLDARIFATSMEPELVSIAGIYRTFDAGFPKDQARKPAQIRLIDNRLDIMALEPNTR
jgi:septum site-determining protein MinC